MSKVLQHSEESGCRAKNIAGFLLVAIEYFSKWVEAEALASITEAKIMDFIWRNIVCRFGIPRVFVMDNGRQLLGRIMKEWCEEMGIERRFTSVGYPQA